MTRYIVDRESLIEAYESQSWSSPEQMADMLIDGLRSIGVDQLTVHPYTCGSCSWEGPSRTAYYRHCLTERHDHWRNIIELRIDAAGRDRLRALVDRRMIRSLSHRR